MKRGIGTNGMFAFNVMSSADFKRAADCYIPETFIMNVNGWKGRDSTKKRRMKCLKDDMRGKVHIMLN